jgi:N-acyl amino acid synthase of PEP-CTERM/exosortase system
MPIYKLLDGESRARLERLDPATLGEVSRYSVSKRFRRREGEEQYPDVGMSAVELADTRRLVPHISLGLFRAVGQLAAEHEVTMVCAAMAPALLRLLARFGFDFETLGPLVDYHGLRQPCLADIRGLAQGILKHDAVYGAFVTTTR